MNLIEGALGYLSAGVIEKASLLVGESPAGTRRALETAVPAIVAGLGGESSRSGGPARILRVVADAGLAGPQSAVSERLTGASGEELIGLGKDLLGRVFGGRLGGAAEAAARAAGVAPASMIELAGLAAPLVFGVLGSTIHARHLDAAGLAGLLGAQRGPALHTLPTAVASAIPDGEEREVPPPGPAARPRERAPTTASRLWPLLLLIPVALLAGLLLHRPATEPWVPRARLGAGLPAPTPAVVPGIGVGGDVAAFLASPIGEPSRRFTFDDLAFATATADLTPPALAALDGVADALKAYPGAVLLVEGHTDATGNALDNLRLAVHRADAVKDALVARGVSPERIATAGFGQDRPIAPNDTAEGRARNRRTELIVTR